LAAHSKLNRYSLFLRRCLFFFRFLYRNNKQHILLKQSVSNAIIKQVRKFFYKSKTFLKRRILLSGLVAMKNNGQFSPGKYIEVFVFGFLFSLIRRKMLYDLSKILNYNVKFGVIFLYNSSLNVHILANFFISSFRRMYLPREVVYRFFQRYRKVKKRRFFVKKGLFRVEYFCPFRRIGIRGLLVKCAGRFTRQQRASFNIFKYASVPLSTLSSKVNYIFRTTPLKFGAVGLKIFLLYGMPKK